MKEVGLNMGGLKLFSDYAVNEKEESWLVEGMLNMGGVSLLVADPKVGKSQLSRHLISKIISKMPFLGKDTLEGKHNVIYLALEDIPRELKKYLESLGINDTCKNLFIGDRTWCTEANIDQLEKDIREHAATFCVIDTFMAFSDLTDLNEYARVYKALKKISDIARNENCHILIIHHKNKSEGSGTKGIMGSQAFYAAVDTCFILSGEGPDKTLEIRTRYTAKVTVKFRMSPTEIEEVETNYDEVSCKEALYKKIRDSEVGYEFRNFNGFSKQSIQKAKQSLLGEHLIYETGGTSGDPLRLFIRPKMDF